MELTTPITESQLEQLRAGDRLQISGKIYTARDAAHAKLIDLIERGEELPIPLSGEIIYYVGPAPARPGKVIGSAGPTTSYRMDSMTIPLLKKGLGGMIGKGIRSPEVKQALTKYKSVYLAAVGGAAALIARSIKKAEIVAYPELGPEAIRKLQVEKFPVIVANDVYGNDLYRDRHNLG